MGYHIAWVIVHGVMISGGIIAGNGSAWGND